MGNIGEDVLEFLGGKERIQGRIRRRMLGVINNFSPKELRYLEHLFSLKNNTLSNIINREDSPIMETIETIAPFLRINYGNTVFRPRKPLTRKTAHYWYNRLTKEAGASEVSKRWHYSPEFARRYLTGLAIVILKTEEKARRP